MTFVSRLLLVVVLLVPTALAQLAPVADHHMHVLSPAAAEHNSEKPLPAVKVPEDVARLLAERTKRWNDPKALAELFTEDSMVLDPDDAMWIRGRERGAAYLGAIFAKPYEIRPVEFAAQGSMARMVAYYTRPIGEKTRYFGHVLLSLAKGADGMWRIAAEAPTFRGPWTRETLPAEQLIAQLDEAGMKYGAVLSAAYWFRADYEKVKAENDWMAAEVAKYPQRLVGFCGLDPLQDYAVGEIERCAKMPVVRGIKMQFGNSRVDVRNAEHVEKLRRVFRAANDKGMAVVAHLWNGRDYGREDAEIFLSRILPEAPDVPVQIAHFAGGGPGYTDEALAVFADAITAKDPRTKNLYFDFATVADQQPVEVLKKFAERIRQVGLKRVLYGTDSSPPNPRPRQGWLNFRATVPLTEEEFKTIAANVAPYFRMTPYVPPRN